MYKLQWQCLKTERKPKRIRQTEKAGFSPGLVKLIQLFLGRGDFVFTVLSLAPVNIPNFVGMNLAWHADQLFNLNTFVSAAETQPVSRYWPSSKNQVLFYHLFGFLLQVYLWVIICVKCKKLGLLKPGDNILQHFKPKMALVSAEKAQLCHCFFPPYTGKAGRVCWRK